MLVTVEIRKSVQWA